MEEDQPKTRLYLDLDGVVYPIDALYDAVNVDYDDADIDKLHDREWWRKSIVNRLGSMGVEVVLASSWGRMFLGSVMHSPKESIAATRALYVDMNISKADAVASDLAADPVPFVWIDDCLTPDMINQVKAAIPEDIPGLYVKTHSDQGLTSQELDAIEQMFVKQV